MSLDDLLAGLAKIPRELWTPLGVVAAGAFTAIVAFIGVMLQNRSAERRHRRELDHYAEQQRLEREAELRKITYLEAATDLARYRTVLRETANPRIPLESLALQLKELQGSSSKLYLIAGPEIVRALSEANRVATEIAAELAPVRFHYEIYKASSEGVQKIIIDANSEIDSIDQQLQSKEMPGESRKELELRRETLRSRIISIGEKRLDRLNSEFKLVTDMLLLGHKKGVRYDQAFWKVIVAIRKELGFPIVDESEFLKVLNEEAGSAGASMEAVMSEMEPAFRSLIAKHDPGRAKA